MKIVKCLLYVVVVVVVVVMISVGVTVNCYAAEYNGSQRPEILLIVTDSSREAYGTQLKNKIFSQLRDRLNGSVNQESEAENQDPNNGTNKIKWAESDELSELAGRSGSNQIIVVEILPIKSNFSDILFYKAIKSEVTLRIRLYDAVKKQYILSDEVIGEGINKTYIPYTSVGKKQSVLEAVGKATRAAAEKINQSEAERR